MLQSSIVSCSEHFQLLILEAHPFLVDHPRPWGKLKVHKVGRVLKLRAMFGLYNMNEIIFEILFAVITANFFIVVSQKIIKKTFQLKLAKEPVDQSN